MNIVKKAGLAALMAFVMLFVLVPVFAEETDKANAVAYVTRKDSDQAEYFDTLQSALNAVQDGGSVVLLQDITGNGPSFRVGGGKSFSFDLAGHEMSGADALDIVKEIIVSAHQILHMLIILYLLYKNIICRIEQEL